MTMRQPAEIPATDARDQISDVISKVAFGGERVVITRNGKAQVAVIPISDLDRLKQLDEQREARRLRAANALTEIQKAAAVAGLDRVTDEEIDAEIANVRKSRRGRAAKKADR